MFWRRRRDGDDFSDEVRAHLEHEEAELRDAGWSAEAARAEARRRFGSPTRAIERVRETHPLRVFGVLGQDIKYGVRRMRRAPAFSIAAILVFALGIGANTALFSIANSLFFRPLPVKDPGRLFYVFTRVSSGQMAATMTPDNERFMEDGSADLADYAKHWRSTVNFGADGETDHLNAEWVTSNYFSLLGVGAVVGRVLQPEEDDPANPARAIVISHDLWTRRFNGDPGVIGKEIRLNDRVATIVGVLPLGFRGLSDAWTPIDVWVAGVQMIDASFSPKWSGGLIGRVKPGVTFAEVEAQWRVLLDRWKAYELQITPSRSPQFLNYVHFMDFSLRRASDVDLPFNPDARLVPAPLLAGMIAVVALVLIIATANVAGLLLARGVTRGGEIAVQRALGAGTSRLVRQLLTESSLFAVAGGAIGLGVAAFLVQIFRVLTPSRFAVEASLDLRVLVFAVIVCLGAGLLVGLAPARQAMRVNVLDALGNGLATTRAMRGRLRYGIVVPQIALSLLLLVVAGVHVRALSRLESADLGYRIGGAVVLTIDRWEPRPSFRDLANLQAVAADRAAKQRAFDRRVLARVAALPSVTAYALTDLLPLSTADGPLSPLLTETDAATGASSRVGAWQVAVSNGYFDTMGMRLLRGRAFDDRDTDVGRPTAIVSEAVANTMWQNGDAVGHEIAVQPDDPTQQLVWLEIVGVVNDVEPVLNDIGRRPRVYTPLAQKWDGYAPTLVVRGPSDRGALIRDVKAAVVGADTFAEVSRVKSMTQMADELLYPRRIAAAVLAGGGLVGLLLAWIGLYGVVSYSVAERVREIGIRATLGADERDIVRMLLREGAAVIGWGSVAGLVLAALALAWTATLLPGLPHIDLVSFIVMPIAIAAIVLVACWLPAHRAARVDPAKVLRGL